MFVDFLEKKLTEKVSELVSGLIILLVMTLLGVAVLIFLAIALANWLAPYVGGTAAAYAIVAGVLALLMFIVYICRRPLIIKPMFQCVERFKEDFKQAVRDKQRAGIALVEGTIMGFKLYRIICRIVHKSNERTETTP